MNEIQQKIITTIAWYDMFDYPLTQVELGSFLEAKFEISDFVDSTIRPPTSLAQSKRGLGEAGNSQFAIQDGFYFLPGREKIIEIRMSRYIYTDRKFKRALWLMKLFQMIPWIRMVAVANLMGAHNLRDGGDIDLFVITEKKKIYSTRLFSVALTMILGLRPGRKTKDKICLSFFVSEDSLCLDAMRLDNSDPYFDYWLLGLTPIFDTGGVYHKFMQANQGVIDRFPNWQANRASARRMIAPRFCLIASLVRVLFFWLEPVAKLIQNFTFSPAIRNLKNKDTRVVVTDSVMKLYPNDKREEYREKFLSNKFPS